MATRRSLRPRGPATVETSATGGGIRAVQLEPVPDTGPDSAVESKAEGRPDMVGRLVEPIGIEPTTSCLQSRRSPS